MQPPEVEHLSAQLERLYARAHQEILDEQEAIATDPTKFRRKARLRELQEAIEARMGTLDQQADSWLSTEYPFAFRWGAEASAAVLGQSWQWSTADIKAVTAMAADAFEDLLRATQGVTDSTKRLVRRLSRDRTILGRLEGETAVQSARRLRKDLERHGIHSITYADGSRHGLKEYTETVLRTKTAQSYAAGQINTAQRFGVKEMTCFDSPDCGMGSHADPEKPNGKNYPIDTAATFAISHPRCVRAWVPAVLPAEEVAAIGTRTGR